MTDPALWILALGPIKNLLPWILQVLEALYAWIALDLAAYMPAASLLFVELNSVEDGSLLNNISSKSLYPHDSYQSPTQVTDTSNTQILCA